MMRVGILLGLAGLALATWLFAREGFAVVLKAVGVAGFGIVWASLFHFVPMAVNAQAWRVLVPGRRPPGVPFFTWLVWTREAVNGLLPVARIGGELVSGRLMMLGGVRRIASIASLVVDMTLSLASQFIFTLIGIALLLMNGDDMATVGRLALGAALAIPVVGGLFFLQRQGMFTLALKAFRALFGDRMAGFVGSASRLDRAVRVAYRRRDRVLASLAWQVLGWILGGGEIWIALYFLGHPVTVAEAVMIEAVIQAVSSAAFVVPAAIGLQEGAFMVMGSLFGLPGETALALALMRRARDLLLFVPALMIWQAVEGRRLFRRSSPSSTGGAGPAGRTA